MTESKLEEEEEEVIVLIQVVMEMIQKQNLKEKVLVEKWAVLA